ncbi:MAG: hypothetical protein R6X22_06345, partial [Gemmatimonadota bacterium]
DPVAVSVATVTDGTFREPILYAFQGFPAGIGTGGTRTVNPPYDPQAFAFGAAGTVAPGTYSGTLTGTTSTAGTISVPMTVIVQALPVIDAITPPALSAGSRENLLRITGRNFHPAAAITSNHPAVQVVESRVLTQTTAEVVVSARRDAAPGAYRLDIRNPDGSTSARGAMLTLHPPNSMSGPLAVTGVRLVSPRPWQVVAEGEALHPRALLATSGMGTVVGTWVLDGTPFERFTRVVSGGQPVEVRATMPIPVSFTGEHRLELVLENPRTLPPQGVTFLQATESRSALRVLVPDESGRVAPASPRFRWSLVPGASGYEIEVRYRARGSSPASPWTVVRRRVSDAAWRPEQVLVETLGETESAFRVKAVFPGEVDGEPTEWRTFRLERAESGESVRSGPSSGVSGEGERAGEVPGDEPTPARWSGPASTHERASDPATALAPDGRHGESDDGFDRQGQEGASLRPAEYLPPAAILRPGADIRPDPPRRIEHGSSAGRPGQEFAGVPGREVDLVLDLTTAASSSEAPGPSALTRLQLSTRVDARTGRFEQQLTGDFSASQHLDDPWHSHGEGENWIARMGAVEGAIRPEAIIGFSPPSFLDGSELLSVFTSGGGVQGTVRSAAGRVSYYRSARLGASGNPAFPDPRVDAAAYEAGSDDGRYLVRATTLRVTELPIDAFSAGGRGEAWGMLASATLDPRLEFTGEVATGEFSPGEGALDEERDGTALRLSARGAAGTLGYSVTLGRTGAGFVNPANPGFTPAGTGARTRAELSLSNTFFGRASVNGIYNHGRGGSAGAIGDPRTIENGANVTVSVPATSRVFVSLAANVTGQRGDAIEALELPATERTQKGLSLSVMETLGGISLSQSVGVQDLADSGQPWADQRVTDVQLGAFGSLHPLVDLSSTVSTSRVSGSPELGGSRYLLFSLHPSVSLGDTGLRLTPRAAYTKSSSDAGGDFRTTQYQVSARWTAPWEAVPLTLELSSDFNRTRSDADVERPPFVHQTRISAGLKWQTGRAW